MSTEPLIAHYRITAKIGEGGMGAVYQATDTKLNRAVAIKVLPEVFGADPDRLARFAREAQVLASLNHPNIAAIYGVEDRALVLELVEGPTLEDRIAQGPIAVREALEIAVQVAEALEYAHEKGVIHRDLKPANIKLTAEGRVKLLDFGLAKAMAGDSVAGQAAGTSPTMSPTLTMRATVAGVILGTAGYMAPEQAAGKAVDRRADIWSFGVVLYEMLTGKMLFTGETVSHTLASVLKDPIDVGSMAAPAAIRQLLGRCLNRDPRERLRDIGEARIAIREWVANPEERGAPEKGETGKRGWGYWVPLALCVVLAAGFAVTTLGNRREAPRAPVVRFSIPLGEGQIFSAPRRLSVAISPDGSQVAYVANKRIYLRPLADTEAREIPGTEQHEGLSNPVFPPDGKTLVFWSVKDRNMVRLPLTGGAATKFCGPLSPAASVWSEGWLLVSTFGDALLRCSGNGGAPETIQGTKIGEYTGIGELLPGGGLLFTRIDLQRREVRTWDRSQLTYQDLKTGQQKILGEGGSGVRLLPTGHLVYEAGGVLFGAAFDGRAHEVKGDAVGLIEGVSQSAGTAQFAISATGTLVYIPGPVRQRGESKSWLATVNRKGESEVLKAPPGVILYPRISRDGRRVAYQNEESGEGSIWVWVMGGGVAPRRLTLPGSGSNRFPVWSGDGERIAYQSDREGDLGIWWQRADGAGAAERLTKAEAGSAHVPDSWSGDGQFFSYTVQKDTTSEVWIFSMRENKGTRLAAGKDLALGRSVISRDGKWVAYQSTAGAQSRIYVQPYPATGAVYLAPEDGDMHHPAWSADGKELFYVAGPGSAGSVRFETAPAVSFGSPVREDRTGFTTGPPGVGRTYDVLPDGKGFLGVVLDVGSSGAPVRPQIRVVVNWFEEVKRRIPVK